MTGVTILRALTDAEKVFGAAGIESARLDAEVLLAEAFGKDRTWLFARFSQLVPPAIMSIFNSYVDRRRDREPVAYIRGRKEFMSIEFEVTRAVLIPRPETESICETVLDFMRDMDYDPHMADMCTGSGCIAVAVAVHEKRSRVTATDISDEVIEVARRNACRAGVEHRIKFCAGDLFDAFSGNVPPGGVDAIAANPPYVAPSDWELLPPEASVYEPAAALRAGDNGFSVIRRILENAAAWLRPGGLLAVEMSPCQVYEARDHIRKTCSFRDIDDVRTIDGTVCGIKARRTI